MRQRTLRAELRGVEQVCVWVCIFGFGIWGPCDTCFRIWGHLQEIIRHGRTARAGWAIVSMEGKTSRQEGKTGVILVSRKHRTSQGVALLFVALSLSHPQSLALWRALAAQGAWTDGPRVAQDPVT
jgi:hypothetical protein